MLNISDKEPNLSTHPEFSSVGHLMNSFFILYSRCSFGPSKYFWVFNPNSSGVKYTLIVLLTSFLVKSDFLLFRIETLGICYDYGSIKQGYLLY